MSPSCLKPSGGSRCNQNVSLTRTAGGEDLLAKTDFLLYLRPKLIFRRTLLRAPRKSHHKQHRHTGFSGWGFFK